MEQSSIEETIRRVLASVEPYVAGHSGHIDFVSFEQAAGKVTVRLQGACAGCGLSQITLRFGLEEELKKHLPNIVREVVAAA